jgi:hypothetical protein
MGKGAEYDHHVERARAEMDCAYRAAGEAAGRAHMTLAALHMHRAGIVRDADAADPSAAASSAATGTSAA